MAKLSHQFEYFFSILIIKISCWLSPQGADRFGRILGRITSIILFPRKKIAFQNIKNTIGQDFSDKKINLIVKDVFHNIGRTFVEVSRFNILSFDKAREIIIPEGTELLRKINSEGKGGIFVTAHFGNWELLGYWLFALGYKADYVVATQHNDMFDKLLTRCRRNVDCGLIRLGKNIRDIYRAFDANKFVVISPDQHDPTQSLIMDFLGKPASIFKGPAVFSLRTGVPIIPVMMRRERFDKHVIICDEIIYPPENGLNDENVEMIMGKINKFIEGNIKKYPDQWLWTHRRWKVNKKKN